MARHLTHNVSFRVPASEMGRLQALRATFPEQQWGVAMRWLFDQPEVEALIEQRAGNAPVEVPTGGMDASLPRGDR